MSRPFGRVQRASSTPTGSGCFQDRGLGGAKPLGHGGERAAAGFGGGRCEGGHRGLRAPAEVGHQGGNG
jgi:hypothetical protein